jgi:hypothetical protein
VRDLGALPFAPVWRTETESEPIRAFARIAADVGPLDLDRY